MPAVKFGLMPQTRALLASIHILIVILDKQIGDWPIGRRVCLLIINPRLECFDSVAIGALEL